MIRYRKYQNNNAKSPTAGSWYARAVYENLDFDEFIKHVAEHHSVFGEATLKGCFAEVESCLRELMLDGKCVELGTLGKAYLGIQTKPATTAEEFTDANIKGVKFNLWLGPRFRRSELFTDASFKELAQYTVPAADATT